MPSLQALLDCDRHEVVAVITRPDSPAGRGRQLTQSPIKQLAELHGVPVLSPMRPSDPELAKAVLTLAPDCCPVVAYGGLIRRPLLDIPVQGWVNLHFSLLPAWRGAAPVQHAIMAGDEFTGASTFLLEEGLDTGPVIGTLTEQIRPTDTSGALLERLAVSGAGLLLASLDALADGTARPLPQPLDGVSLAPKLTVEGAKIDWRAPALAVDRLVRGCTPEPGAWSSLGDQRIRVLGVTLESSGNLELSPGALWATKDGLWCGTGSAPVKLGEVQPASKRPMAAVEWARGLRLATRQQQGEGVELS